MFKDMVCLKWCTEIIRLAEVIMILVVKQADQTIWKRFGKL